MNPQIKSAPEEFLIETGYKVCLGGCGIYTKHSTGYCTKCRPEEDVVEYDFKGESK